MVNGVFGRNFSYRLLRRLFVVEVEGCLPSFFSLGRRETRMSQLPIQLLNQGNLQILLIDQGRYRQGSRTDLL